MNKFYGFFFHLKCVISDNITMHKFGVMKWILLLLLSFCLSVDVFGLDNGLGLVPQMGWNSWNRFGCNVSEDLVLETAKALVSSGLADVGYRFVNLDDCVFVSRNESGYLVPDPKRFPHGIRYISDEIHKLGLNFGLYTDAGHETCQGRPGLYGHDDQDANSFAEWGVDYIKVDWCHSVGMDPRDRYPTISKALNKTGRPIFFSACEWGVDQPWTWAMPVCNSWRISGDISDRWSSFVEILAIVEGKSKYAGKGGWNDPDMLEVGNGGMSHTEYKSHFTLWSIVNAPLLAGNDIRVLDSQTKDILGNSEIIALNQDKMSVAGDIVNKSGLFREFQVWSKPMDDGSIAVALLNEGIIEFKMKLEWEWIGLQKGQECRIRDLWAHKDWDGKYSDEITASVVSHGVVALRLWC